MLLENTWIAYYKEMSVKMYTSHQIHKLITNGELIIKDNSAITEKLKEIDEYSKNEELLAESITYKPLMQTKNNLDPEYVGESVLFALGLKNMTEGKCKITRIKSEDSDFMRMLTFLDNQSSFHSINVGVLYVGREQFTEKEILQNSIGSTQYEDFISKLYMN